MSNPTDALAIAGRAKGIFRQCSIGYHLECSDPTGQECKCSCHPERVARRALPLPTQPGIYADREGYPWRLDTDDTWWFGNDDSDNPHDYAPFVRLVPEGGAA